MYNKIKINKDMEKILHFCGRLLVMMVFLGIAMPLSATDYDTTIVVNSSADTIGLGQLKVYMLGIDNSKSNRICVKNSERS